MLSALTSIIQEDVTHVIANPLYQVLSKPEVGRGETELLPELLVSHVNTQVSIIQQL